jgi:hypothetical protein
VVPEKPKSRRPTVRRGGERVKSDRRVTVKVGAGRGVVIDPLQVKVAVVTEALGSQAKAAEFLDVARSQPGRWLRGEERPNPTARRRIQDFDYVWDRLTSERSAESAALWLRSPNSFLDGIDPLTWLRTRGPDQVVAAVDAEEAGSYA